RSSVNSGSAASHLLAPRSSNLRHDIETIPPDEPRLSDRRAGLLMHRCQHLDEIVISGQTKVATNGRAPVFGVAPVPRRQAKLQEFARNALAAPRVGPGPVSVSKSGWHPLAAQLPNGLVTCADHRPRDPTVPGRE